MKSQYLVFYRKNVFFSENFLLWEKKYNSKCTPIFRVWLHIFLCLDVMTDADKRYRLLLQGELWNYNTAFSIANEKPGPTRPDAARPWRSLTAYFSNLLEDTSLKLSHNKATGFKITVPNFYRDFFNKSEVIAFLVKTNFCHFYIHFCV